VYANAPGYPLSVEHHDGLVAAGETFIDDIRLSRRPAG
jgi:hypothetical protein